MDIIVEILDKTAEFMEKEVSLNLEELDSLPPIIMLSLSATLLMRMLHLNSLILDKPIEEVFNKMQFLEKLKEYSDIVKMREN